MAPTTPSGRPDDPQVIRPDLTGLRVLAHPLRLQLLGLLRTARPGLQQRARPGLGYLAVTVLPFVLPAWKDLDRTRAVVPAGS